MDSPIDKPGDISQLKKDNNNISSNNSFTLITSSPEETFMAGKEISEHLSPGSVIALSGALGSGKTQLAKGIASGLGITENITSPTYTIINEYRLAGEQRTRTFGSENREITFYHIDVYRLDNEKDFEDIGGEEILYSDGICVIEWSERIAKLLPEDCINISIEVTGDFSRVIQVTRR